MEQQQQTRQVKVWDGFIRLWHWLLVVVFGGLWWTAENGEMVWHSRIAYALGGLVFARLIWGVVGSESARFTSFIKGPKTVFGHLKEFPAKPNVATHNPLGGWAVMAMLMLLLAQFITGLFSSDDILFSGPLASWVGSSISGDLAEIHEILFDILLALVAIHVVTICWYQIRGINLIVAMVNGKQKYIQSVSTPRLVNGWLGIVLAAICIATSYWLFL